MLCLYTLPLARPAQAKVQMLTTSSCIVKLIPWTLVNLSHLYCTTLQGRNPYNFCFMWEKRWLHKFILQFTDLYGSQVQSSELCTLHKVKPSKLGDYFFMRSLCYTDSLLYTAPAQKDVNSIFELDCLLQIAR